MGIEIEAKMRLDDPASLEAKLQSVGGQRVVQLLEENTFFDTPQGSLRASDRGLRLRIEQENSGKRRVIITHKGPRAHGKIKSRMETEVEVSDAQAATQLLIALGFTPTLSFQKKRTRWELDDCLIELDTLPHLGHFVEIEGGSEAAIMAVRGKLGLSDQPLIRTSYIAMLTTYLTENHVRTDRVTFESA